MCEAKKMLATATKHLTETEKKANVLYEEASIARDNRLEIDNFIAELETFVDLDRLCSEMYIVLKKTIAKGIDGTVQFWDKDKTAFKKDFWEDRLDDAKYVVRLPRLPKITRPRWPTVNMFSALAKGYLEFLKQSMFDSMAIMINAIIAELAQLIDDNCDNSNAPPPESAISDSTGKGEDYLPSNIANIISDFSNVPESADPGTTDALGAAFQDILKYLTISELCSLLKGEASPQLLERVRILMIEHNPFLASALPTTSAS